MSNWDMGFFIANDETFPAPRFMDGRGEEMELHPYTDWYNKQEKKPHTCPVCGGTGQVPAGFYVPEATTVPDVCRSCNGSGVLWEKQ